MKTLSENLGKSKGYKKTYDNQRQAILLSYMAGIIDGEGCIRIGKCNGQKTMISTRSHTPKYVAYIQLGMVDKIIPELFQLIFGGSVREECVSNKRSIWRWAITSRPQVIDVLQALRPYLLIKTARADCVMAFCKDFVKLSRYAMPDVYTQELRRREDAFQMMRKFNAVGAAAETERKSIREDEATVRAYRKL